MFSSSVPSVFRLLNMNTGLTGDNIYDFSSEENSAKWKGLLTAALKKVSEFSATNGRFPVEFVNRERQVARGILVFQSGSALTADFSHFVRQSSLIFLNEFLKCYTVSVTKPNLFDKIRFQLAKFPGYLSF